MEGEVSQSSLPTAPWACMDSITIVAKVCLARGHPHKPLLGAADPPWALPVGLETVVPSTVMNYCH